MKAPFKLGLYTVGLAIIFGASFTTAHLTIPAGWSSGWTHTSQHPATAGDNATH